MISMEKWTDEADMVVRVTTDQPEILNTLEEKGLALNPAGCSWKIVGPQVREWRGPANAEGMALLIIAFTQEIRALSGEPNRVEMVYS